MAHTDRMARIRIELDDVSPGIWRRIEVPLALCLNGLHQAIQAAMLFEDYHLFQFDAGGQRYAIPDPDWDDVHSTIDARNVNVGTLIDRGVTTFKYTYDFGDDWRHTITIEAVVPADPAVDYPRFVDGAGRAPPEDVGGIPGFEEFLEAMTAPRHPERKRLIRWYGREFDPNDFDAPKITARLAKLARRRVRNRRAGGSTH